MIEIPSFAFRWTRALLIALGAIAAVWWLARRRMTRRRRSWRDRCRRFEVAAGYGGLAITATLWGIPKGTIFVNPGNGRLWHARSHGGELVVVGYRDWPERISRVYWSADADVPDRLIPKHTLASPSRVTCGWLVYSAGVPELWEGDTLAPNGYWRLAAPWRYLISPFVAFVFVDLASRVMRARRTRRRAQRVRQGLCPDCGYDVRAGGERCPECGGALSQRDGTHEAAGAITPSSST